MKKFIVFILICAFAFVAQAQDRTLTAKTFSATQNYYLYTGVAADSLSSFQDSISFTFRPYRDYPCQVYILTELDTVDGVDTTITCYLQGRMFDTQAWTTITNTATAVAAATENVVSTVAQTTGTMAWDTAGSVYFFTGTYTNTSVMNFYREFRLIWVSKGNDHVGEGVLIKSFAIKVWRREY